jgi:hypothetical protein
LDLQLLDNSIKNSLRSDTTSIFPPHSRHYYWRLRLLASSTIEVLDMGDATAADKIDKPPPTNFNR